MNCPRCGNSNPEGGKTCILCGWDLTEIYEEGKVVQASLSLLALTAFILSILGLVTFCLTALPAIVIGTIAISRIRKSRGKLKGELLAMAAVYIPIIAIPVMIALCSALWRLDAPPIPNDYTVADLKNSGPQYDQTYELLLSLSDDRYDPNGAPAIGLNIQDVNSLENLDDNTKKASHAELTQILTDNADMINRLWQNSEKGRDVITQFNQYDQIADLTETSITCELKFFGNFKNLAKIYNHYCLLNTLEGDDLNAVKNLIELDSIPRKLSTNAGSVLLKLICYAILAIDFNSANFIVNSPSTSDETLQILQEHFKPLTETQLGLKNCIIWEYLAFKKMLKEDMFAELPDNFAKKRAEKGCLRKYNSSCRVYRNFCDYMIDLDSGIEEPDLQRFSPWPRWYPIKPQVSLNEKYEIPWYYWAYNPLGSGIVSIMLPAIEKVLKIKTKIYIYDDLFHIVLAMRMDQNYSLKARAYTDEYIIDLDKKIIYSPGPDLEPFTDDDIKLEINPEVLGLTE